MEGIFLHIQVIIKVYINIYLDNVNVKFIINDENFINPLHLYWPANILCKYSLQEQELKSMHKCIWMYFLANILKLNTYFHNF